MDVWGLEYAGRPFVFLDSAHLIALALVLALNVSFVGWRRWAGPRTLAAFRWTAAAVLLANEAAWLLWNFTTGQWNVQTILPLHLCSVMVYLGAAALLTRSQALFEPLYYLGIGGALQALLTPNIGAYGFPHFRFLTSFISHGLILSAPIYLTLVERLRPTWAGLWRTVLAGNVYMCLVGIVNWFIGSNYMYIAHKPETSTVLDRFGPWPWYILGMEALGLSTMLLLYLPFAIGGRRVRARAADLCGAPGEDRSGA
jgi:hypothetical integral membrane protein (TIGR02206 family)